MARKLKSYHKKNPPKWLERGRDLSHTSEKNLSHYKRSLRYFYHKWLAIGPWTNDEEIDKVYAECARRRAAGEKVVVDHIVPLVSGIVCGLECHWNMAIVSEYENTKKSNRFWPDCPQEVNGVPEQAELLEDFEQFTLFRGVV